MKNKDIILEQSNSEEWDQVKDCHFTSIEVLELMQKAIESQIEIKKPLEVGQNLLGALERVCDFTAIDSEMQEITNAVELDQLK